MGVTTALLLGGAALAGAAASGAFNKPDVPKPQGPPPIPTADEEGIKKRRVRPRRGRAATIITGDLTPETIGKKGLLGG